MFFKNIFVVLTYRNTNDLQEFLNSLKNTVNDYKVIIVNSFYDEQSRLDFESIANENNCIFINVENKGYSYGNNIGIDYANKHFDYNYLIVSNPDIVVRKFNTERLDTDSIFCGNIETLRRNLQNPQYWKELLISRKFIYAGFKSDNRFLLFWGIIINKISRFFFTLFFKNSINKKIFQPHGAFIIFSKNSIQKLNKVFDENVFLFSEESILAKKAKSLGINIYYTSLIDCLHKEDGSMKLFSGDINDELKKSNIYCYEKYWQSL